MKSRPTKREGCIRIGGGSAYFNDRVDAAVELVEEGDIDVLMFETLAERTLALLQVAHRAGAPPYWERLPQRLEHFLPACAANGTALVTNGGGVDPLATAKMVTAVAEGAGIEGCRVAAVIGDDVSGLIGELDPVLVETGAPVSGLETAIIGANACLGSTAIAEAFAKGADVIVTGRVTDSALAAGPAMAALGWSADSPAQISTGVLAGHLLECGAHASGGYFAEPGLKDVPGIDAIGYPIGEITEDLSITITKPPLTGGRIDRHTVIEQMLYEMHDPSGYLTSDVTLDITALELTEPAADTVRITGVRGRPAPDDLKVLVAVDNGVLVEIEISYAGINAKNRGELARDIIKKRVARTRLANQPFRYDLIGVDSLWPQPGAGPQVNEVRLRVAARVPDTHAAEILISEVESLYVAGPAGGGGVRFAHRPTIRTYTAFVPRHLVTQRFEFVS